jgi:hypothetical protein
MIPGAIAALLLLDDGDAHFSTAAVWPDAGRDLTYLTEAAQQALTRRTSFVDQGAGRSSSKSLHIAQPIECAGALKGVVVIDLARATADMAAAIRQLRWGTGWLDALFGRQKIAQDAAKLARTNFALQVLAEAREHNAFVACMLSVANDLASRLKCCRVAIGIWDGKNVRLRAISHTAVFNERTHIVSALENAMEEAVDQNASVAVPPTPMTERRIALAHEDLAKHTGTSAIASVVMKSGALCIGAILLERDRGEAFDDPTIELLEAVAALVGPELDTRSEADKFITGRAVRATRSGINALFGRGRPSLKIAVCLMACVLAYVLVAKGDFRISAKAVVEGAIQHASVAPFDGYVATAPIRAGDVVDEGQVIATLDDRELKLEAARWKSEHEQQALKYSDAMAKHDRAAALVASAAMDQTQAQLSLVEDKLSRAAIKAPFRGVVVSGDLSQMLGSPVEKGKSLFEIAPLDSFRVILQVDERDISYLAEGQTGTLVLTGFSNEALPLSVKTVTPVATASEGRNHFRVEADVHGAGLQLRPGMEGIGKVVIDQRPLLAIWTRSLLDWLRLTIWKWTP